VSPCLRTVKTYSGATAVQIVQSSHRGSRDIERIVSAHAAAEVELLRRQRGRSWRPIRLSWTWRLMPERRAARCRSLVTDGLPGGRAGACLPDAGS
jgi:hypothetical protein